MLVGTVVRLKVHCLGNPAGTLGVCYDKYELDGREGHAFIFENGNYDGFGPEEVNDCLEVLTVHEQSTIYKFKNVMQLSRDFENGVFADAFTYKQ